MDPNFGAELSEWHDFFATVAGVSGTLVGLLFVAVGLNPSIMADESPAGLRILAGQTFHSFLVLLIVGIVGLVPDGTGQSLMITLAIVGVQGVVRVAYDLSQARVHPDQDWRGKQAVFRVISPFLAYVTCLWLVVVIWRQDASSLTWFIMVVLLLTIGASATCWDLLKVIGERFRQNAS